MEEYLRQFDRHKDIFQEFRTLKKMQEEADPTDRQLRLEGEKELKATG